MLSPFSLPIDTIKKFIKLASTTHNSWEKSWQEIEPKIESQGHPIKCKEGCNDCCFTRKFCTLSEGLLISDYMQNHFSPERHEHFRLRIESNNSFLSRLRKDDLCDSESTFYRSGGMECPFLEKERCAIYPVRPLDCRTQIVTSQNNIEQCRQCPRSVCCIESEAKNVQLHKKLKEEEQSLGIPPILEGGEPPMIPEILSFIWESGVPSPTFQMTERSWKERLNSRGTDFDQTWQDDRHDFKVAVHFPLVLPKEGEHPSDLVVLNIKPEVHQIYNELVKIDEVNEIRVLYKLLPGGYFDWKKRAFRIIKGEKTKESHIVWMGDSLQERLMMWEAAKRCRGHVLCGGMGMGIFPQYALSLPQVESVHIVDMDNDVISLIKNTWRNNPWPRNSDCTITQSKIEEYLKKTTEKFDTVYIDTWDALTEEYLPHINYLRKLSQRVLKPGGEILLWGYYLMTHLYLNQATNILDRRDYFLSADEWQMDTLSRQLPVFHNLLRWFKQHPDCADDDLYSEAYQLAIKEIKNLGVLSCSNLKPERNF